MQLKGHQTWNSVAIVVCPVSDISSHCPWKWKQSVDEMGCENRIHYGGLVSWHIIYTQFPQPLSLKYENIQTTHSGLRWTQKERKG